MQNSTLYLSMEGKFPSSMVLDIKVGTLLHLLAATHVVVILFEINGWFDICKLEIFTFGNDQFQQTRM